MFIACLQRLIFLLILDLVWSEVISKKLVTEKLVDENEPTAQKLNTHGWLLHLMPPEDYIVDYDDEPKNVAQSETSDFSFDMLKPTPAKIFHPQENVRKKRQVLLVSGGPDFVIEEPSFVRIEEAVLPPPQQVFARRRQSLVDVEAELEADFPVKAPRARALYNIPEGHNLEKSIDGDFLSSVRLPNHEINKNSLPNESEENVEKASQVISQEVQPEIHFPKSTTKNPFEEREKEVDLEKIDALEKEIEKQKAMENFKNQLGGRGTGAGVGSGGLPIGVGANTGVGVGGIGVGTNTGVGIGGLGGGGGPIGVGVQSGLGVGVGPFGVGVQSGFGIGVG
uniref:Uncharacterized protein n=1 Tax=Acrobeloides nanus TaxID=290746 RepID=A0A914EA37_9BILA